VLLAFASAASAETINVSNTEQLAEAVTKANANSTANTIVLANGSYVPGSTLILTNTKGVQTIEGSTTFPGATLNGVSVEPPPSEILAIRSGVSAKLKRLSVTTGGGAATPAIDNAGTLEVESSLIAGNTGPGVHVEPGSTATIRNSTLSDGLDFALISSGTTSFFNSTVAFNANGGVDNKNTLNLTNTIVAENKGSGDCTTKAASTADHSLDSDGSCGVGALSKTNPLLEGLANNGGPNRTHAEEKGSLAIDAGNSASCPATDQRGFPRPDLTSTACDIGAFEFYLPPHYYLNSLAESGLIPEGLKTATVSWGTLTLTPTEPSKATPTTCETSAGGFAVNPTGGGAGGGATSVFGAWNCENAECTRGAEVEFPPLSGKKVTIESVVFPGGRAAAPKVLGGSLPWPNELTQLEAKKIRSESKEVVLELGCIAQKSVEGTEVGGDGDGDAPQFLSIPTFCSTRSGEFKQEPLTENGTQIGGPLTSKLTFDSKSGALHCKGPKSGTIKEEVEFSGTTGGKLKLFTYEGQEVLDTK
jgi:hypothetical protein